MTWSLTAVRCRRRRPGQASGRSGRTGTRTVTSGIDGPDDLDAHVARAICGGGSPVVAAVAGSAGSRSSISPHTIAADDDRPRTRKTCVQVADVRALGRSSGPAGSRRPRARRRPAGKDAGAADVARDSVGLTARSPRSRRRVVRRSPTPPLADPSAAARPGRDLMATPVDHEPRDHRADDRSDPEQAWSAPRRGTVNSIARTSLRPGQRQRPGTAPRPAAPVAVRIGASHGRSSR